MPCPVWIERRRPYVVPPDAVFDPVNGGYRGPMVRRRFADGATSGRFEVARVAGRLFPQARGFAERVRDEGIDEPGTYAFSPWPHDRIQRLSKTVVTFATPGGMRGLGHPGGPPYGPEETSGVVVFETSADGDPALLRLDVRLGSGTDLLASAIATAFLARLDVPKESSDTIVPSPPIVTGSDATAVVRAFTRRSDVRMAGRRRAWLFPNAASRVPTPRKRFRSSTPASLIPAADFDSVARRGRSRGALPVSQRNGTVMRRAIHRNSHALGRRDLHRPHQADQTAVDQVGSRPA